MENSHEMNSRTLARYLKPIVMHVHIGGLLAITIRCVAKVASELWCLGNQAPTRFPWIFNPCALPASFFEGNIRAALQPNAAPNLRANPTERLRNTAQYRSVAAPPSKHVDHQLVYVGSVGGAGPGGGGGGGGGEGGGGGGGGGGG